MSEEVKSVRPSAAVNKSFIDLGMDEAEDEVDGIVMDDGSNYYNLATFRVRSCDLHMTYYYPLIYIYLSCDCHVIYRKMRISLGLRSVPNLLC